MAGRAGKEVGFYAFAIGRSLAHRQVNHHRECFALPAVSISGLTFSFQALHLTLIRIQPLLSPATRNQEIIMIDTKKIEQLARQVHEAMPKGIREFGDDVEKKIRQVLQAQLTRMDLVNREEFDVQTQVLLRTREKLAALEQRLAQLESHQPSAPAPAVVTPDPAGKIDTPQ